MKRRRIVWAFGGLFAVAACATLDPVGENQCGNGVVEAKEDCDGFPRGDGTMCRAPGTEGECHLDCAVGKCPAGWGCGTDGLCREPSGRLEEGPRLRSAVTRVMVGDLDGDKRADTVTMTAVGPDNTTKVQAHFFDADGTLDPKALELGRLGTPSFVDFDKTGQKSIAASTIGANFFSVTKEKREIVPTLNPSDITLGALRAVPVFLDSTADSATAEYYLARAGTGNRTLFLDSRKSDKFVVADLGDSDIAAVRVLAGRPGKPLRLLQSSSVCGDVLLWSPASRGVLITSPCSLRKDPATGNVAVIHEGLPSGKTVALPAGAPADLTLTNVVIADLKNAHVIFMETRDPSNRLRMYASTITPAGAIQPTFEATDTAEGKAIYGQGLVAIEDLDGDGVVDLVTPQVVTVGQASGGGAGDAGAPDASGSAVSVSSYVKTNGAWAEGVAGDFNGDGKTDIVARVEGQSDFDLVSVNAVGIRVATVSTERPPTRMVVGDFDGDGVSDVAYAEKSDPIGDALAYRIRIVFGERGGTPSQTVTLGIVTNLVSMVNYGASESGVLLGAVDALGITTIAKEGGQTFSRQIVVLGSAERRPTAPVTIGQALPAAVVAGALRAPGTVDVAVLPFALNPCGCDGLYKNAVLRESCTRGLFFGPGAPLVATQPGREFCTPRLAPWDDQKEPAPTRLTETPDTRQIDCRKLNDPSQDPTSQLVYSESVHAVTADLDADGVDEVVVAQSSNSARAGAAPVYNPAKLYRVGRSDARPDTSDCRAAPTVFGLEARLLKTSPLGTLAKAVVPDADLAVLDVDLDGKLDVVLVQGTTAADKDVVVLFGEGGGKYGAPAIIPGASAFASARVTSERGPSLVVATLAKPNGVYELRRVDGRQLTPTVLDVAGKALKNVTGMGAGDVDGDGIDDIVVVDDGVARVLKGKAR